jgi:hypothetical protein
MVKLSSEHYLFDQSLKKEKYIIAIIVFAFQNPKITFALFFAMSQSL